MKEYEVTVKVKVDVSNYNNVTVSHENVVEAVKGALENYREQMSDAITSSGDWSHDCEAIGSSWAFEVK